MQGDIVAVYNMDGEKIGTYTYDAWGNFTTTLASTNTAAENDIVNLYNPFRYRGYYYDVETGLYYLQSRYYNPAWGRFINSDGELAGIGNLQGYNLFAYCFNNPVNLDDLSGEWPKWLSGALNVISGAAQMVAGAAVGAFASWTGVGAVVAGFLIVNGAATATQGIGQIVNDATGSDVMREDNIVRTGVQEIGKAIGGETGSEVAGNVYDAAVVVASVYTGGALLDKAMPSLVKSAVFSMRGGYGIKLGNHIELLYRNPHAAGGMGGTIFSYKGPLGKLRLDWDPNHSFHFHPPGHR